MEHRKQEALNYIVEKSARYMNATKLKLKLQKAQLSIKWADHTAYIRRPASDFR